MELLELWKSNVKGRCEQCQPYALLLRSIPGAMHRKMKGDYAKVKRLAGKHTAVDTVAFTTCLKSGIGRKSSI
jgi:hypothetical protein